MNYRTPRWRGSTPPRRDRVWNNKGMFHQILLIPHSKPRLPPWPFPISPGGQPAPSCSCRRAHRTSCRSASGRACTPPRGTSWYHCTLPGTPSASFQCPWYQLGRPTAGHKARSATQNSQAAPCPNTHPAFHHPGRRLMAGHTVCSFPPQLWLICSCFCLPGTPCPPRFKYPFIFKTQLLLSPPGQ